MNHKHLFFNRETNNLVIEFEKYGENIYIYECYNEKAWDSLNYYGNQDEVDDEIANEMMEDLRNSKLLIENRNF